MFEFRIHKNSRCDKNMLKYRVKPSTTPLEFIIPLDNNFGTADKEEAIKDFYIEEQIAKSIPEQKDYEITRYYPTVDEIIIQLFKDDGVPFYYSDFGFTDSDLMYFYNRLQMSFVNITLYTLPNKLQRVQKFQIDLFVQRANLFNGTTVKKSNECEMIFNIKNPKLFTNETEGFFIYLKNNEYQQPFSLYSNFRFNNALNGISSIFYPHKDLTPQTVVDEDEYVKIDFVGNNFIFNTNNTLTYNSTVLNIDLYALIV